jgi:hypothetical protein
LDVQDLAAGVGSFWSLNPAGRTGVCVHDVHGSRVAQAGERLEDFGVGGMGRSRTESVGEHALQSQIPTAQRYGGNLKSTDQTDWGCSAARLTKDVLFFYPCGVCIKRSGQLNERLGTIRRSGNELEV